MARSSASGFVPTCSAGAVRIASSTDINTAVFRWRFQNRRIADLEKMLKDRDQKIDALAKTIAEQEASR